MRRVASSVVHILLSLLSAIAVVAIVAGGGYIAYKVMGARRRRQVRDRPEEQRRPRRQVDSGTVVVPPATPAPTPAPTARPAATSDVDDELARLKREMGH